MYTSVSPTGVPVQVPEDASEDRLSLEPTALDDIRSAYFRDGYALIRNLVPPDACANVRACFAKEVMPYGGLLPRINGQEEVNKFNDNGFLVNSLMNVQKKVDRAVPEYLSSALAVLTHDRLRSVLSTFFPKGVGLMTWNHIVANPVTRPHCDNHFWTQDIEVGDIVGVWIALEDIHAGAGRLYVYPKSHAFDMRPALSKWHGRDGKLANLRDSRYDDIVLDLIETQKWNCTAPSLRTGDVLLWDSRTIHGSLPTTEPQRSRSSFTSHFSSSHGRFIKARTRRTLVNGVAVAFPRFSLGRMVKRIFSSPDHVER